MLCARYVNGMQHDPEQTFATTAFIALAIQLIVAQLQQRHMEAQNDADHESMLLEVDPFSLDAQREIEEATQQQAMLDKREYALEHSSEVLGRVMMLHMRWRECRYVGAHPSEAFVDSGAQSTVMGTESLNCTDNSWFGAFSLLISDSTAARAFKANLGKELTFVAYRGGTFTMEIALETEPEKVTALLAVEVYSSTHLFISLQL
ncbi:hypothetical protein V8D89_003963 [Ganoderma adspersum]